MVIYLSHHQSSTDLSNPALNITEKISATEFQPFLYIPAAFKKIQGLQAEK